MTGFSTSQLERLAKMGSRCDGLTVVIACGGQSGDYCCGGTHRAKYVIELPTCGEDDYDPRGHSGVHLIPVGAGDGHTADSRLPEDDYRYTHGGCVFVSAVDAAKELASALGFPR